MDKEHHRASLKSQSENTAASRVRIDSDGRVQADNGVGGTAEGVDGARGVKIEFVGDDGRPSTLYYFSVNVDNDSFRPSGFAAFCERQDAGDSFVKSASYLMHRDHFSDVRNFLLEHSRWLLEDDSGISVARFDQARWQLRPFGHYSGPISLFANRYQSQLARLFNRGHVESIDFGIARGFRQFLLRGVKKVRAEWAMICTTHNLLKLFTHAKAA